MEIWRSISGHIYHAEQLRRYQLVINCRGTNLLSTVYYEDAWYLTGTDMASL